jgi:PadR family transcriptional regulator PadR
MIFPLDILRTLLYYSLHTSWKFLLHSSLYYYEFNVSGAGNTTPQKKEENKLVEIQEVHKKFQKELSAGTVSLALLSILAQSAEPLYGYQIGKLVGTGKEEPEGVILKQGAIYPVLRSLESQGLLSSEREMSDSGPPRKYYQATDTGKEALESWEIIWKDTKSFVDKVLGGDYQ